MESQQGLRTPAPAKAQGALPRVRPSDSPEKGLEVGREGREKLRAGRRMCGGVYEVALNNLSLIYLIDGPLPVSSIFDGVLSCLDR